MELSPWGKHVQARLIKLGKDWAWICRMLRIKGYHTTMNELMRLVATEPLSQTRKSAIDWVLTEEERRQIYRKRAGVTK